MKFTTFNPVYKHQEENNEPISIPEDLQNDKDFQDIIDGINTAPMTWDEVIALDEENWIPYDTKEW